MSIKEPTLRRTEETQPPARTPAPRSPRMIASAVTIVVLVAAGFAYSMQRGQPVEPTNPSVEPTNPADEPTDPAVEPTDPADDADAVLRDLVNKGLIPREALEEQPVEPTDPADDADAVLRDLVNKGLIPREALES